jgi:hypothetical protein
MDLFTEDRISNLLRKDGTADYYRKVQTHNISNRYFSLLIQNIIGEIDQAVMFDKHTITRRKVA